MTPKFIKIKPDKKGKLHQECDGYPPEKCPPKKNDPIPMAVCMELTPTPQRPNYWCQNCKEKRERKQK